MQKQINELKTKSEAYKNKGQKVPQTIRKKMSELYFAKRAKQGWKGKGKAKVKESIRLSEEELINLIESKSPGARPLYLVIRGSHAYGTNVETSDTDYAGVFIQSIEDILGNKYQEQINDDTNDTVIYEVRRFLELVGTNNPTVLELLNTPEDCVIYKDPAFDLILGASNIDCNKPTPAPTGPPTTAPVPVFTTPPGLNKSLFSIRPTAF